MVLSELTNKELKGILRENDARNYSKLNKKNLVKKVNQLIKTQNGGSKKKYRLRGGSPRKGNQGATTPARTGINYGIPESKTAVNYDILNNNTKANEKAPIATANAPGTHGTPATASVPPANLTKSKQPTKINGASAPEVEPVTNSTANSTANLTAKKNPLMVYSANPTNQNFIGKAEGITPVQYGNPKPNQTSTNNSANNKDACGACSIL